MKDPYETLGANRSATDNEIKQAFKTLARKFHPDLHPDDKEAEAKFKDLSTANDLLKDKEKRRRFDAGEIDAGGAERLQERFYRDFADGPAYASRAAQDGFANNEELEDFLARAFAGGGRRSQGKFRARGQDMSYVLPVGLLEVANGASRTISLPEGKTLQVTIPTLLRTVRCCGQRNRDCQDSTVGTTTTRRRIPQLQVQTTRTSTDHPEGRFA